eukprot:Clim_evm4s128 gene=Clim_evmTU4s128
MSTRKYQTPVTQSSLQTDWPPTMTGTYNNGTIRSNQSSTSRAGSTLRYGYNTDEYLEINQLMSALQTPAPRRNQRATVLPPPEPQPRRQIESDADRAQEIVNTLNLTGSMRPPGLVRKEGSRALLIPAETLPGERVEVAGMVYNPATKSWEGNEEEVDVFDNMSSDSDESGFGEHSTAPHTQTSPFPVQKTPELQLQEAPQGISETMGDALQTATAEERTAEAPKESGSTVVKPLGEGDEPRLPAKLASQDSLAQLNAEMGKAKPELMEETLEKGKAPQNKAFGSRAAENETTGHPSGTAATGVDIDIPFDDELDQVQSWGTLGGNTVGTGVTWRTPARLTEIQKMNTISPQSPRVADRLRSPRSPHSPRYGKHHALDSTLVMRGQDPSAKPTPWQKSKLKTMFTKSEIESDDFYQAPKALDLGKLNSKGGLEKIPGSVEASTSAPNPAPNPQVPSSPALLEMEQGPIEPTTTVNDTAVQESASTVLNLQEEGEAIMESSPKPSSASKTPRRQSEELPPPQRVSSEAMLRMERSISQRTDEIEEEALSPNKILEFDTGTGASLKEIVVQEPPHTPNSKRSAVVKQESPLPQTKREHLPQVKASPRASAPEPTVPQVYGLRVDLSQRGLATLPTDLIPRDVMDLQLSGNVLRTLQGFYTYPLHFIRVLNLCKNELTDLTGISGLKSLLELDVSDNKINRFGDIAGCDSLQVLDIRNNPLSGMHDLPRLANLCEFNMANNQLVILEGLERLPSLNSANFSGNRTTSVDLRDQVPSLTKLDLSHNELKSLRGLHHCMQLLELDVSYNQDLGSLSMGVHEKLRYLVASNCDIQSLSGLNAPNLMHLDVRQNRIMDSGAILRFVYDQGALRYLDTRFNPFNRDFYGYVTLETKARSGGDSSYPHLSTYDDATRFQPTDDVIMARSRHRVAFGRSVPQLQVLDGVELEKGMALSNPPQFDTYTHDSGIGPRFQGTLPPAPPPTRMRHVETHSIQNSPYRRPGKPTGVFKRQGSIAASDLDYLDDQDFMSFQTVPNHEPVLETETTETTEMTAPSAIATKSDPSQPPPAVSSKPVPAPPQMKDQSTITAVDSAIQTEEDTGLEPSSMAAYESQNTAGPHTTVYKSWTLPKPNTQDIISNRERKLVELRNLVSNTSVLQRSFMKEANAPLSVGLRSPEKEAPSRNRFEGQRIESDAVSYAVLRYLTAKGRTPHTIPMDLLTVATHVSTTQHQGSQIPQQTRSVGSPRTAGNNDTTMPPGMLSMDLSRSQAVQSQVPANNLPPPPPPLVTSSADVVSSPVAAEGSGTRTGAPRSVSDIALDQTRQPSAVPSPAVSEQQNGPQPRPPMGPASIVPASVLETEILSTPQGKTTSPAYAGPYFSTPAFQVNEIVGETPRMMDHPTTPAGTGVPVGASPGTSNSKVIFVQEKDQGQLAEDVAVNLRNAFDDDDEDNRQAHSGAYASQDDDHVLQEICADRYSEENILGGQNEPMETLQGSPEPGREIIGKVAHDYEISDMDMDDDEYDDMPGDHNKENHTIEDDMDIIDQPPIVKVTPREIRSSEMTRKSSSSSRAKQITIAAQAPSMSATTGGVRVIRHNSSATKRQSQQQQCRTPVQPARTVSQRTRPQLAATHTKRRAPPLAQHTQHTQQSLAPRAALSPTVTVTSASPPMKAERVQNPQQPLQEAGVGRNTSVQFFVDLNSETVKEEENRLRQRHLTEHRNEAGHKLPTQGGVEFFVDLKNVQIVPDIDNHLPKKKHRVPNPHEPAIQAEGGSAYFVSLDDLDPPMPTGTQIEPSSSPRGASQGLSWYPLDVGHTNGKSRQMQSNGLFKNHPQPHRRSHLAPRIARQHAPSVSGRKVHHAVLKPVGVNRKAQITAQHQLQAAQERSRQRAQKQGGVKRAMSPAKRSSGSAGGVTADPPLNREEGTLVRVQQVLEASDRSGKPLKATTQGLSTPTKERLIQEAAREFFRDHDNLPTRQSTIGDSSSAAGRANDTPHSTGTHAVESPVNHSPPQVAFGQHGSVQSASSSHPPLRDRLKDAVAAIDARVERQMEQHKAREMTTSTSAARTRGELAHSPTRASAPACVLTLLESARIPPAVISEANRSTVLLQDIEGGTVRGNDGSTEDDDVLAGVEMEEYGALTRFLALFGAGHRLVRALKCFQYAAVKHVRSLDHHINQDGGNVRLLCYGGTLRGRTASQPSTRSGNHDIGHVAQHGFNTDPKTHGYGDLVFCSHLDFIDFQFHRRLDGTMELGKRHRVLLCVVKPGHTYLFNGTVTDLMQRDAAWFDEVRARQFTAVVCRQMGMGLGLADEEVTLLFEPERAVPAFFVEYTLS